jgi:hypothetical protein
MPTSPYPRRDSHDQARAGLRSLGFLLVVAGGVLMAIGLCSFFGSVGQTFGPGPISGLPRSMDAAIPHYFWCAFVGMPLLGVGIALLKFGYLGAVARYAADEVEPAVAPAARDLAHAVAAGVRDSGTADAESRLLRLEDLRAKRLITEEEFGAKRAEILRDV